MKSIREQLEEQLGGNTPSISSLTTDRYFPTIAEYMRDRNGMSEEDYSREEIRDAYVNSMRSFNTGNSISVANELSHLYSGEGDELVRRRETAGRAYELWDNTSSSFSGDSSWGESLDAVADYGRALILDPVNVASLGIGKFAAQTATRGTAQGIKLLASQAAKEAAKEAAKRGVKGAALERIRRETAQQVMQRSLRGVSAREAARRGTVRDIVATGVTDMAAGVLADAGVQEARQMTGVQEGYDPLQGAIAAAGGAVGMGLAGTMAALRGTGTWRGLSGAFEAASKLKDPENAAKAVAESVSKTSDWKLLAAENAKNFQNYVEQGRFLREAGDPAAEIFETHTLDEFMKLFRETLKATGIPMEKLDASIGQRRSGWYIEVVENPNFPTEVKDFLQEQLDISVTKDPNIKADLVDYLKVVAERASEMGKGLRSLRATYKAAKAQGKNPKDMTVRESLDAALGDTVEETTAGKVREWVSKGQHTYIRMLVTHPATTALNVLGWTQASMSQSYSDLLRGTLYGGTSMLNALVGRTTSAAKYAKLSRDMYSLQIQKIRNLADPISTKDEVLDYLVYRPEAQKNMFRYLIGGTDSEHILKELDLVPGETLSKSKLNKAFDMLQTAYGVNAQDMFTKTQEFAYSLDKQIRLNYGMSYRDFLAQDNIVDIMTNPKNTAFKDYAKIEGQAIEDTLRNVYAKKFGPEQRQQAGPLSYLAGILEDARNVPVVGALLPFGQFFNNSVAFMLDYTGASLLHRIAVKTSRDHMELVTKAAAGWSMIGWAASQELENLEAGLAWDEERTATGDIRTRIYDFPVSFWKMAGRIAAHRARDGEVPVDLVDEFMATFSIQAVTRTLGDSAVTVREAIDMIAESQNTDVRDLVTDALSKSVGMYASGMTRFLDPVNTALAFAEGENYIEPTRNVGNKELNNAIRYTDQIIDSIIGLENLPFDASGYDVEKHSATTNRDTGANLSRIFGYRRVAPTSSTQRLFNDIGKPDWQTNLRVGDGEAQNIFNDYIFPYMEYRADELLESGVWESLSVQQKQKTLNKIMEFARQDVKEVFAGSTPGGPRRKANLIYEINGQRSRGVRKYREVLEIFGVSERELGDLEENQLELLLEFMKEKQSIFSQSISSVTPE